MTNGHLNFNNPELSNIVFQSAGIKNNQNNIFVLAVIEDLEIVKNDVISSKGPNDTVSRTFVWTLAIHLEEVVRRHFG